MNKKLLALAFFAACFIGFSEQAEAVDYSIDEVVKCTLTTQERNYWSQTSNFQSYLSDLGIPLTKNGYAINKNYALNRCILVYGTPYDVPTTSTGSQKAKQSWSSNGEPRYLGYGESGQLYANPAFPNDEGGGTSYLISWEFIRNPWNNSTLVYQGNSSSFSKPPPIPRGTTMPTYRDSSGHLYTEAEELDRAIDMQYYFFNPNGSKGLRGYFPDYNPYVGHTMRGANLVNYASVVMYPTAYTSGQFVLYSISHNTGTYWYATYTIPAHKPLFKDTPDLYIKINSITPNPGHTNETATIDYSIFLKSSYKVNNVDIKYGWATNSLTGKRHSTILNSSTGYRENRFTLTVKYPKTNQRITNKTFYMYVNADKTSPKQESDWSNNDDTMTASVQNGNAYVKLFLDDNSNLYARVYNQMIKPITRDCTVSSSTNEICKPGTTWTTTAVRVYDTKNTSSKTDDVLVRTISVPNYTISPTGSYTISFPAETVNSNIVKKYRVVAEIPYFNREVDMNGAAKYGDNQAEDFYMVYAPAPKIDLASCNEVNASYLTLVNGVGPIKSCAGHYPKYPSTNVESGMGAYHFVMWRFLPTPLPPYSVSTPVTNPTNPNYFKQTYTLNEPSNTLGNTNSFLYYPTSSSNSEGLAGPYTQSGQYKYRGRLMPTDATFTFSVYDTIKDSSAAGYRKNVLIAFGSVAYDIPSTCYNAGSLDLIHKYGCDEIMFFVPNSQANMFQRPGEFTGDIDFVTNPIKSTKIPYLNPGKYVFELKANENFQYRYQWNKATSGYDWQKPVWYNNPIN